MINTNITNTTRAVKSRPSELDKRIGKNISIIRKHQNITQVDLAKGLGITSQQIAKYEKGENRVTAGRLLTIAKVLGVDIALMYEEQVINRKNNAYIKLFEYLAKIECSSQLQKELYNLIEDIALLEFPGGCLTAKKINAISSSVSKEDCSL